ncbi:uncharacterized protein LOC125222042 [Salvia hispanica]|uniref:uncharacterized protein LOC125222042 n=1 Tax=Salvia hispanica TaxID=49212 RepID=UPI002009C883|nr:uncharacterized protein LOC125222042 [Salvia hispanica]
MKRGLKWSDGDDDDTSSSDDNSAPETNSQDDSAKKKRKGIDFEALSRHGYRGGLSVLKVPPPKEAEKEQDWSWCSGKEQKSKEAEEESFKERQKTRDALADGEQLAHVLTRKEKNNLSFQQKEKRKRDLGQASRGKNYVEEEKRLLRDNGVYSGFDS